MSFARFSPALMAILFAATACATAQAAPLSTSDVAFAEEIVAACARIRPQQTAAFEARKKDLFAAEPELVAFAKADGRYPTFLGFARTVLEQLGRELPAACDKFLLKPAPNAAPVGDKTTGVRSDIETRTHP